MNIPRRELTVRASALLGGPVAMWIVRVLDSIVPGPSAAGHGIVPRTSYGLDGIPVAPFIHADYEHLIANTIPFLVLGAIILLRGVAEFGFVTLVTLLTSGVGTWLLGTPGTEHIGASGIVFGFFGYLVFRAIFDRRWSSIATMLVIIVWYGASMMYALVSTEGISWVAHFFGLLGGYAAARMRYQRAAPLKSRHG
jgi:membrane associated rhomboid family serine protease